MHISWNRQYAQRTRQMKSSAIRELLKVTEQPDVISFAGGLPAPEVFPVEMIAAITQQVLREDGAQALQYCPTEGYRPLRERLARQMARDNMAVSVENILIVSGSQQALDLVGKIFIDPGDPILVESPTYMGTLQAWSPYGAEYVALPSDEQGIILDTLEPALQKGIKCAYIQPNFQNPSGRTLSLARRKQLVELTQRYGVPVIEDDPYGELRFEGDALPSLFSLTGTEARRDGSYAGHIIYLGTFSKVLAPGLRLGWIVAPPEVISRLVQAKQGADLQSATFTQMIAAEIMREGFIEEHLPYLRQVYRTRRDVMIEALEEHFPQGVRWTYPNGGLFLWITLPEGLDATNMLVEAVKEKVTFVPGDAFHPNGGGANTLRLSFSNAKPEQIREGIARLARVVCKHMLT
jgi:2-aminoadipate transaminase